MQSIEKVRTCYNRIADEYATEFGEELSQKPFDRMLLKEFAAIRKNEGLIGDFGCGPGQTTKFLADLGISEIMGVDLSPEMVRVARKISPEIRFETGDILNLPFNSGYFGSVVAFYAIVHFTTEQLERVFNEINRVLKNKGHFLFSFHIGDEQVHHDTLFNKEVDIDFYFFQTEEILGLLDKSGFKIADVVERYPYKEIEYPSKRAYIRAKK